MKLVNGQYVIELDDIVNNSEIEETDLIETFGDNYRFDLARISSRVYSMIYGAYKGLHRDENKAWVQTYIEDNDKKNDVRNAIIEFLRYALITGGDLKRYETGLSENPQFVESTLNNAGLWLPGEKE